MRYNKNFTAFLEEALFTKEVLTIGVTQLHRANYARKGVYYQSFTCLATGIERLEKLCLILDYYITHGGELPTENYIRSYGHKISVLFQACRESAGRYSNVNVLLGKEDRSKDCMDQWYYKVDMPLYEKHISEKKKQRIEQRANEIGALLRGRALISYIGEDDTEVTEVVEASKRTGIWEAVASYRQLYMLRIIRYLTELLRGLEDKARRINPDDIPWFGEVFGMFYNEDSYFRERKTWDKL